MAEKVSFAGKIRFRTCPVFEYEERHDEWVGKRGILPRKINNGQAEDD
jgi:hypothetical protein